MSDYQIDDFEEYFVKYNNLPCYYNNYKGIVKKDFPKWAGWKIIAEYRLKGYLAEQINDTKVDLLVRNFYYINHIREILKKEH